MFSLRCDYRENRGGCIINRLKELRSLDQIVVSANYDLVDEVLTTGDYVLQCGAHVLVVERKTWEDLASSIKDKRIFRNHQKMLDARTAGFHIMYLIEGRAPSPEIATIKVSGIPYGNMMAKLDHFAFRDGVIVEYTRDAKHTAMRLLELGKHMATLDPIPESLIAENKTEQEERSVSSSSIAPIAIGGAMQVTAPPSPPDVDSIVKKKFTKTTAQLREEMLACVPGIGDKTARALLAKYAFPDLITGKVAANELRARQTEELKALAVGERKDVVVSMLSTITGISTAMAQNIANAITLDKLATRDTLNTEAIAELKTANGRRLGNKIAERVSECFSDENPLTPSYPNLMRSLHGSHNLTRIEDQQLRIDLIATETIPNAPPLILADGSVALRYAT